MATTVTIPLTTLAVGPHTAGPSTVGSNLQSVTLTIDRTVAGGLNSLTSSSVLSISFDMSTDGGTTWQNIGVTNPIGGIINHHGGQLNTEVDSVQLGDVGAAGRKIRAVVTVQGPSSIAVAGSLTTSP